MHKPDEPLLLRRRILMALAVAPFALALAPFLGTRERDLAVSGGLQPIEPTPECADADEPTPAQTAGPFYTPRSPERQSLVEPGMKGTLLTLDGKVWGRDCAPIAGALVDFWQADDDGEYDNEGYRLRGHQFTDAKGAYRLETIVPGLYSGRTRHIHVRVQPRDGRVLTTQLYFPWETANRRDGLFTPELLMTSESSKAGQHGRFDFVLATSSAKA